mgnify:CR=1 FL=1
MTGAEELNTEGVPLRRYSRQGGVNIGKCSNYAVRLVAESRRVAYTQDRSDSGLGLDLPERVRPGELLRVTLRDIDGQIDVDGLARVVWCKATDNGRPRAGVSMLRAEGQRTMMRVRGRGPIAPAPGPGNS